MWCAGRGQDAREVAGLVRRAGSGVDVLITHQIVEAGKLLDIDVLDHLVIGQGRYCSMREKGLGFAR